MCKPRMVRRSIDFWQLKVGQGEGEQEGGREGRLEVGRDQAALGSV